MKPNICWIDLETTGLDPHEGVILEVACVITNWQLESLASYTAVIHHPPSQLDNMNAWCRTAHEASGLTSESRASPQDPPTVMAQLHNFIKTNCNRQSALAGSSVHFDRAWLNVHAPSTIALLSHRNLDVSSIRMLFDSVGFHTPTQDAVQGALPDISVHRALPDICYSIALGVIYRRLIATVAP
jgi:oligoribonuclease